MDTVDVLAFQGSAPLIALIISMFLKPVFGDRLSGNVTPIVCLVLASAWGGVLQVSGYLDANPATFIVSAITVAAAASGLRTWQQQATGKNS